MPEERVEISVKELDRLEAIEQRAQNHLAKLIAYPEMEQVLNYVLYGEETK